MRVAAETAPTFQAKIFNAHARAGFTLLELMIVLSIVAALVALALPRLGGQNNQMRQAVRKLSSLTRELQTNAKLQGAVFRLVIDLKSGPKSEGQTYWVEKSTSKTVLSAQEMSNQEDPDRISPDTDEDAPKNELFSKDEKLLKGGGELPGDLRFESVEVKRLDSPMTEGKVYIHFFPQGLAEEAAIHLFANEKMRWTLAIHPLTGKSDIITEHVSLKQLSGR